MLVMLLEDDSALWRRTQTRIRLCRLNVGSYHWLPLRSPLRPSFKVSFLSYGLLIYKTGIMIQLGGQFINKNSKRQCLAHKNLINVSHCYHYLQLELAFSLSPKCRPQYTASISDLPRTVLLLTYQMPLEMRLSDYILRLPGDVKESTNSYNQRDSELDSILEGKQRRRHPQRKRGNI